MRSLNRSRRDYFGVHVREKAVSAEEGGKIDWGEIASGCIRGRKKSQWPHFHWI